MRAPSKTVGAAADAALATTLYLRDPERVLARVPAQSAGSLNGLAGTALLHARMSAADPLGARAALAHWEAAFMQPQTSGQIAGIYSGPGALAASLILGTGYLTDPPPETIRQTARGAAWLGRRAIALAHAQRRRVATGRPGAPWCHYDTISGLSGIGRILLAAAEADFTEAEPGLRAALTTLTALIHTPPEQGRPGWWLPADEHPRATGAPPSGAATTGVAHGIAGPLALLARAHRTPWTVPGQHRAISFATRWLLHWHDEGPDLTWPPHVSGTDLSQGRTCRLPGRRSAWCYGTPGIVRALQLAGRATGDTRPFHAALSLQIQAGTAHGDTHGPGLCHGHAGIVQAAHRAELHAGEAASALLAAHDPRLHDPGLLTGATGSGLALADLAGLPGRAATGWDALLLLT